MKRCLTTACLVAVALGTPDHMPHTVQTDKKPVTKDMKAREEIKKIEPIILHSKMSKDQEAQLANDVAEVEKMRKALAKAEKQAVKVEPVVKEVAKVAEKKVATPTAAPKVATPVAAVPKSVAPKAEAPKVEAPKVVKAKVVETKAEHKIVATTSVKPEVKQVAHEKKAAVPVHPAHHEVAKSAAAKMAEGLAKAEAEGEKLAVQKMSANSHKHIVAKQPNLRRIPVMRPRNFAKVVEQWEAGNPVGNKGHVHNSNIHLSHPHIAALPVVKALPWTSTPSPASTNSTKDSAAVNFGAQKKVGADVATPEVIAKFTESAQASAERAHKHLEEAKKAYAKTSANADQIHATGKKIEKTAGTIKYLYSTPEPPHPPTTEAPAPPKVKSAANSPRSFLMVASVLAVGASILAC